MANALSTAFDTATDTEQWLTAVVVFVGFMAPLVVRSVLEDLTGSIDLPDEVYGVLVIIVAEFTLDEHKRHIQIGGGLYTVNQIAERFGAHEKLSEGF